MNLYVELMTITRYAQVVASVMGYASLSFLVVLAYYGKLKLRWAKLAGVLASIVLAAIITAAAVHVVIARQVESKPSPYLSYTLDPAETQKVEVSYAPAGEFVPLESNETVTERIQRTGVLRVGYNPGTIPFCYRNVKAGAFDIAMSGIYLTRDRLINLGATNPYFQSPLAFFTTRDKAQNFLDRRAAWSGLGRVGRINADSDSA